MALLQFESFRRGLAASAGFNLFSQAVGFLVLVLFARFFGASEATDIYLYCVSSVLSVSPLITCLNASVVVPETMRLSAQHSTATAVRFFNCYLYVYLLTAGLLAGLASLHPARVLGALSSFDPEALARHALLLRCTAPMLVGEVVATSLNDLLVSRRFFTAPMLSTTLNRMLQAVGLVALQGRLGIYAMPTAVLAAYGAQILALLIVLRRTTGWSPACNPRLVRRQVAQNSAYAFAGSLMSCLAQLVPLYLLSGVGTGVVSAVNYANRILNIPQAFLVNHAASVTGIRLNELQALRQPGAVAEVFLRTGRGLVFLLAPLTVLLFVGAAPAVRLLFERGSFDASVSFQVALFLQFLGLSLPLLGINALVARLFMAAQKIRPAFFYQCAQNLLLILGLFLATRHGGALGYAIAFPVFHLWNALALVWLLRHHFPQVAYSGLLGYLARMLLINLVLATPLAGMLAWVPPALSTYVVLLGVPVFGAVLLLLQHRLVLSPELNQLLASLQPGRATPVAPPTRVPGDVTGTDLPLGR